MSKPVFIFVPGAWHTPSIFARVIALLSHHGYTSHGLSLPSVDANPGLPDFSADVTALQDLITTHLSAGADVIVAMNSYGGMVATEAVLPSMLKSARAAEGKKGGVLRLVYLAANAQPVGSSVFSYDESIDPAAAGDVAHVDAEAGIVTINPAFAGGMFYNDIEDPETVSALVKELRPMSLAAMGSRLSRAAWSYAPATFVVCERDNAMPVAKQERMIKEAKEVWEGAFDTVVRCPAAHAPMASMPEVVVEVLRKAAGEDV